MPTVDSTNIGKWLKSQAPYILTIAAAFFIFELYLFLNSFHADYEIYQYVAASTAQNGYQLWPILWLSSELVGEVGLILRFTASILLLTFAVILNFRKSFSFSFIRKSVFLEAIQYFFFIPFLIYLFTMPIVSTGRYVAASSYVIQLLLIFPTFTLLFLSLRKPTIDPSALMKSGAIALIAFMFALWAKHFLFAFYALPLNLEDPILLVGFLNSTLTILLGAILLVAAFIPTLKGKGQFNQKLMGAAFSCVGLYFVIYVLVSLFNSGYLSFLLLTELWAISFLALGLGLIIRKPKLTD